MSETSDWSLACKMIDFKNWTLGKKMIVSNVLMLFFLGGMVQPALSEGNDMTVRYNKGLQMMTADKNFKFQIGGRLMADFAFFDPDNTYIAATGDENSGAEYRAARIYIAGLLYNSIKFKAQYDFASTSSGEQPNFKDVYIQLVNLPVVGNFKVGHYKEPWSLENLTSFRFITFMERSLPNAFSRGRSLGLGFFNYALDKRLTWNVGVFFDTASEAPPVTKAGISDGAVDFGFRVTGLPLYQDKGKKLVHVGFSFAQEDQGVADTLRIRSRPEAHLTANRPVDTGTNPVEKVIRYNLEAAGVYGPFSLQFEYMLLQAETPVGVTDVDYSGWYLHASYFITGEHRKYKTKSGTFSRVSPKQNFGQGGWGAVQVALRYSTLDLNDNSGPAAYLGGKIDNITVGLNWYLNPNTRFMLNYINSNVDSGAVPSVDAGSMDTVMARFQVDF